jgi:hypothetical protein
MVPWCQNNNYKLLYWTHDVTNTALNSLYQRKRTYASTSDNGWFYEWPYTELRLEKDFLFKTGSMRQFVYSINIDPTFVWKPVSDHIIYSPHNGIVDL